MKKICGLNDNESKLLIVKLEESDFEKIHNQNIIELMNIFNSMFTDYHENYIKQE